LVLGNVFAFRLTNRPRRTLAALYGVLLAFVIGALLNVWAIISVWIPAVRGNVTGASTAEAKVSALNAIVAAASVRPFITAAWPGGLPSKPALGHMDPYIRAA